MKRKKERERDREIYRKKKWLENRGRSYFGNIQKYRKKKSNEPGHMIYDFVILLLLLVHYLILTYILFCLEACYCKQSVYLMYVKKQLTYFR